jgi:hypothetical protein
VLLNSDSVESGKRHRWPTASGRSHHLVTVRRRGGRASVHERLMSTWTPAPSPFLLHLSSSTAARPSLPPSLPSVFANSGDAPRCNHRTTALATLCTASPPPLLHRTPTGLPNHGMAWLYFEFRRRCHLAPSRLRVRVAGSSQCCTSLSLTCPSSPTSP